MAKCRFCLQHSTPYNPQGNGIVERVIQTLKASMRKELMSNIPIDRALEIALTAYNTATHSSTGASPFFAMFHRDYKPPLVSALSPIPTDTPTLSESIQQGIANRLTMELQAQNKLARRELAQDKSLAAKRTFNKPSRELNIGNLCWIFSENAKGLQPHFREIVRNVGKSSPNYYIVEKEGKILDRPVNIRRLVRHHLPRSPLKSHSTKPLRL